MFEVSFSQAWRKVEFFPWRMLNSFFLLVSALLSFAQWFMWVSYRVRFVLSFCLFFLLWASLSAVVHLSADDWASILFCLLFRWGILYRVLLVVGWCWVLYSGGFLCLSSHYLIFPRVQFSSVMQSYRTLCDPLNCCTLGLLVHQQLQELGGWLARSY